MIITCNLEGHLIIKADGTEEDAVWVGQDGSVVLIYESAGKINRLMLQPHPWGLGRTEALRKASRLRRSRLIFKRVTHQAKRQRRLSYR